MQHLDKSEIGKVTVEPSGRPPARFLDGMYREFQRHAAGLADAVANTIGEHEMVAVARAEVGAGLGDTDDRPARPQLLKCQTEVEIALQIERRHLDVIRIVEPGL